MGNCCGAEEDKHTNVNIKDKRVGGGKGVVGSDPYSTNQAIESNNILDFTNDRVREIYTRMSEYKNA